MSRRTMLGLLLWLIAGPAVASRLVQEERVPKVDDELGALLTENPATMQLGREGRAKLEGRGVNGRKGGGYAHGHGGAFPSFLTEDPASRSGNLEHEGWRLNGRGEHGATLISSLPKEGPASRASSNSEQEGRVQLERRRLNGRGGGRGRGGHGGGGGGRGRGRGRNDRRPGQGGGNDDKGDDERGGGGGGGGGDGGTGICIGYCPGGGTGGGGGGGGGGSSSSASTQSTTMTPAPVTSPNTTTP